ncbi:hypothetical protein PGT21_016585 [Puccinia graminis f. sp. tritici]|uniref:Uncharacterized protein n=1 Tax=Puccinia graminis f. sp. tritici TaxID=56615 RepID=A0A5B0PJW7_PUCGR|nr:hypothetical protein PGT21_016585 [Puccinia graminis f. sp. tritici]
MPTAGRHVKPAWEVAPTAAADTSRKEAHQTRWAGAGRLAPREISRRPTVGRKPAKLAKRLLKSSFSLKFLL